MFDLIRDIRHKYLKSFSFLFIFSWRIIKYFMHITGIKGSCKRNISKYGPFILNGEYFFSNFSNSAKSLIHARLIL